MSLIQDTSLSAIGKKGQRKPEKAKKCAMFAANRFF
jgi:hypothetical protein